MVDASLFLPEHRFDAAHADLRKALHIPPAAGFVSKPTLGLRLIEHVRANGLEFEVIGCDSLYGRNSLLRAQTQVLNDVQPQRVDALSQHPDWPLQPIDVRRCERGILSYACAARRVWTISANDQVHVEQHLLEQLCRKAQKALTQRLLADFDA